MTRLIATFALVSLLVLSVGPRSSTHQQSQTKSPASSDVPRPSAISGLVTDGGTGRPLSGALVSLLESKLQVSVGMATDAKGRFVFTNLPASTSYIFLVQKPGYYAVGKGQASGLTGPNIQLELGENEWRQHEDVVLWPYGSLSGIVTDEQGEPVVGVPVNLFSQIAIGGTVQWANGPMATTDDRGVYRIDKLKAGIYLLHLPNVNSTVPLTATPATVAGITEVAAARGAPVPPSFGLKAGGVFLTLGQYATPPPLDGRYRSYPPVFYPGSRSFESAVPVDLAKGENKTGIDFNLQPVSTTAVSGRVVCACGAVNGLVVRLLPRDSPAAGGNVELATALVDASGYFKFLGVPTGEYTLLAASHWGNPSLIDALTLRAPGVMVPESMLISFSSAGFALATQNAGDRYFGRVSIAVGGEDLTELLLEVSTGVTVSGRVLFENGTPLRDIVNVRLNGNGTPSFATLSTQVKPDNAAATFMISGVSEGNYFLDANALTNQALAVKSIVGPGGDYTDRPLAVAATGQISDLVITLTDRPAVLTGLVKDRSGSVVSSAAVILFPADKNRWQAYGESPTFIRSTVAKSNSGFKFSRLRAGDYLAVATDVSQDSAWHDTKFLEAAAAVATPVRLSWGDSTILNLTFQQVTIR